MKTEQVKLSREFKAETYTTDQGEFIKISNPNINRCLVLTPADVEKVYDTFVNPWRPVDEPPEKKGNQHQYIVVAGHELMPLTFIGWIDGGVWKYDDSDTEEIRNVRFWREFGKGPKQERSES